jgi:hypothetical protein
MPDAIITSTASTFGTITGTFAADQSTITGTVSGIITGTLSGSVGVPGPAGSPGAPGPGVPVGGTAGQYLQKTTTGVDYATDWVTLNLSAYLQLAGGTMSGTLFVPTIRNLLNQNLVVDAYNDTGAGTHNYFNFNPFGGGFELPASSSGIKFGDNTVQSTAAVTFDPTGYALESWVTAGYYPLTGNPSAFLTSASLSGYATESWVTSGFAPIAAGMPASGTVGQVLTKNSGTSYDASWATLIPGDRYLTSSTTSLTINNANKTLTIGTGLSYTTQQDIVIAHDAANHMHARVLTYNPSTGVMDVDVLTHSGAGTFATWTVNVGGTPALTSVVWGDITGVIGNQGDLATALGNKLEITDAASTYAAKAGVTFTGKVNTLVSAAGGAGLNLPHGTAPTTPVNGDIWTTTTSLQWRRNGATATVANSSLANTFTAGQKQTVSHSATNAGLRVGPVAGDPSTLVDGDIWVNSTSNDLKVRLNGVSETVAEQSWVTAQSYLTTSLASANYLAKAGNLSGLSNLNTARNNLQLGAENTVAFRTVNISEGAPDIDDTLSTVSVYTGSSGYSVSGSTASYVDDGSGSPIVSNSGAFVINKDAFSLGLYPTYDTSNPSNNTSGIELNYVTATGVLALRAFETLTPSDYSTTLSPTGLTLPSVGSITFGDATVQTTAAFNFDPTGYATETFVTSQGYITSAGVPAFATTEQAALNTSATTLISPANYRVAGLNTNLFAGTVSGLSSVVLGTGANIGSGYTILNGRLLAPNALTAGYASRGFTLSTPSNAATAGVNFGTASGHAVRVYSANWGSTVTGVKMRGIFGRRGGGMPAPAPLAERGYGWEWDFSTRTMRILAHNGTTLTNPSVTWNPIIARNYEIMVTSNGSGTISLYIDSVLMGTTTGGPNDMVGNSAPVWWQLELQNEVTASGQTDLLFQNPKVYTTNG